MSPGCGARLRRGRKKSRASTKHASHEELGLATPIVFYHGLGHGLVMYLHLLRKITNRDVFMFESPHISTRVFEHIPSPRQTAAAVEVFCSPFCFVLFLH